MAIPAQHSAPQKAADKSRSVSTCNFRTAGRLSNEDARSLTAIHETFAHHLSNTLDAYLGAGLEVKLQTLDQLPIKDHVASVDTLSYIVPFSYSAIPSTMIVEFDIQLVFPIIELLMGGTGDAQNHERELSEIDEEIMQDVFSLIAGEVESAWNLPNQSLVANRRIKPSALHQYCPPNEKVTIVNFEIKVGGSSGCFKLMFPTVFLNAQIRQLKLSQPQKSSQMRYFPTPTIRERILDCDMEVVAELPGLKVAVRDLIALQPGSVLKLRAPINTPGMLTAGGLGIFEAVPVRKGSQKAAQLGRREQLPEWKRG